MKRDKEEVLKELKDSIEDARRIANEHEISMFAFLRADDCEIEFLANTDLYEVFDIFIKCINAYIKENCSEPLFTAIKHKLLGMAVEGLNDIKSEE